MNYLFPTDTNGLRSGKQNRVNTDRFFHIMNEGWFVYMRQQMQLVDVDASNTGVAGPFGSKEQAGEYLNKIIHGEQSVTREPSKTQPLRSEEDWRYE